jgi:hypothetical protein
MEKGEGYRTQQYVNDNEQTQLPDTYVEKSELLKLLLRNKVTRKVTGV